MNPKSFMLIAGEASGDLLAAIISCRRRREESLTKNQIHRPTEKFEPRHLGSYN
jgi:hypothetical protein